MVFHREGVASGCGLGGSEEAMFEVCHGRSNSSSWEGERRLV